MRTEQPIDIAHLRSWIGRQETQADIVSPQLARAYAATVLDRTDIPRDGEPAPQGLHWCLAPTTMAMRELGSDGHPARGGFLPPAPLPRRMWASSRVRFFDPLRVGDDVERQSTIRDVAVKEGRAGALCFVAVSNRYVTARGEAVEEEQDIVYRGPGSPRASAAVPPTPPAAAEPAEFQRTVEVSPVLLFRYSALTFNGHRIHYDQPYVTGAEGYPGLVVHAPLQASLLLALADQMRPDRPCAEFSFRALNPLFDDEPIRISGAWVAADAAELWIGSKRAAPNLRGAAIWR